MRDQVVDIQWARLAEKARRTNRRPTVPERPLTVAGSWFRALVVSVAIGLTAGIAFYCWMTEGPVWQ